MSRNGYRPPTPERATYTVDEAAERMGVSSWLAYTSIRRGEFPVPVLTLGRRVMVPIRPFERWLETGDWRDPAATPPPKPETA